MINNNGGIIRNISNVLGQIASTRPQARTLNTLNSTNRKGAAQKRDEADVFVTRASSRNSVTYQIESELSLPKKTTKHRYEKAFASQTNLAAKGLMASIEKKWAERIVDNHKVAHSDAEIEYLKNPFATEIAKG